MTSGYDIYSTICPVREHNEWIRANSNARQQTFLCTAPKTAESTQLTIRVIEGFFEGQFQINDTPEAMAYWQVYDRTADTPLPAGKWSYNPGTGAVEIQATPWHQYTISFLAWRVWEEISMYNHVTNNWDKERLMQLNPYNPQAQEYLKKYMAEWCEARPRTKVVRFTSLFYNFAWIWGANERNRNIFTDWGSYDFTVCPEALDDFAKEYGYPLCAEDFVRKGKYNATHRVPDRKKLDWMEFCGKFVRRAARELIDIVHEAGKLAYVFYDDNWLGMEPYNGHFSEFNFDGLIKCVFSGYEARLCAGVPVGTHEIRFHPYLFPVGLGGAPTFSPGGKPGEDAIGYWMNVRRALLRSKIERCGLGGYLHLTKEYPDFVEAMDSILKEFHAIAKLHDSGPPQALKPRIAVLHAWGKLRSWTLSGHFHETHRHTLIHLLESLSGLPFDVEFLSFEDIAGGVPEGIDIIINAGEAGDAWSGGAAWGETAIVDSLTAWVYNGGVFMGFGEPSALAGGHRFLRMAHILGVDIDDGEYACHGSWSFTLEPEADLLPEETRIIAKENVILTDSSTRVLAQQDGVPTVTANKTGKGMGLYCAGFSHGPGSTRLLQNLILFAVGSSMIPECVTDNPLVECAYYPAAGKLAFINNSPTPETASCTVNQKTRTVELKAHEMKIEEV